MNTVWQRVRAGLVVAVVFGVIWGVLVTLSQILMIAITAGFDELAALGGMLALMLAMFVVVGIMQGLLIATGFALTGAQDTAGTFPLIRGALLGALIGGIGIVAIWLMERGAHPRSLLHEVPWTTFAVTAAIGATATTALLLVARRGALPSSGAVPEWLGR
jgi:hypothetical protein